jgi:hypothetical protein
MKIQIYLLLGILACGIDGLAAAQTVQDTSTAHINPVQIKLPGAGIPKVTRIVAVYNGQVQKDEAKKEGSIITAHPGNVVRFIISNPSAFLLSRPTDKSRVVLYVNGVEMKGITSDWFSDITRLQINSGQLPNLPDSASINIKLRRSDTTKEAWRFFYANTNRFYDNFADLNVSIGWEGMSDLPKVADLSHLRILYYSQTVFWLWLSLFVVILIGFLSIAIWTDALRDGGRGGAYSMSLTQLLFWTTLVIGAFIYTLVLSDIVTSFNTSILLLLGISAGTTGLAYAIDSNFAQRNPQASQKVSKSFITDILTDGTGYSVQRIQVFAWNLVLGVYFIVYTIDNKTMPEFSETMLFLAGVSSASYLAAKGPENTNAKMPVGAAGPGPGAGGGDGGGAAGDGGQGNP